MNLYHMCNLLENMNIGKLLVQRSDLFFHDPDLLRTSFLFKSCHGSDPLMNQINKRFSLIHQSKNQNFISKRYTNFSLSDLSEFSQIKFSKSKAFPLRGFPFVNWFNMPVQDILSWKTVVAKFLFDPNFFEIEKILCHNICTSWFNFEFRIPNFWL